SLGVVLVLLVAVYILDSRSHRWFRLGALGSIQPSEFAKPALILFLAYFVSSRWQSINTRKTLLQGSLALAVLAVTVAAPDLGTPIVLGRTAAVMFFVAGLSWRYVGLALAAGVIFAGVAVISKPYRLARVVGYVDPEYTMLDAVDPQGHVKKYVQES